MKSGKYPSDSLISAARIGKLPPEWRVCWVTCPRLGVDMFDEGMALQAVAMHPTPNRLLFAAALVMLFDVAEPASFEAGWGRNCQAKSPTY